MITQQEFNRNTEKPLGSAGEGLSRKSKLVVRVRVLAGCACAAVFLSAATASGITGTEDQPAGGWEMAEAGSSLQCIALAAAADPINLWLAGRSSSGEGNDLLQNGEGRSVLFTARSDGHGLISRPSLLLSEKKAGSRFSYLSWARLHTGFGEFFESNTLRHSRTNGAGVENPHWFYLKLSFRL